MSAYERPESSLVLAERFANIVRIYFARREYEFLEEDQKGAPFDFIVRSELGETIIVETKVYRTKIVQRADVVVAVQRLEEARRRADVGKACLFIASIMPIPVTDTGATKLIDIRELFEWIKNDPDLFEELQAVARQVSPVPLAQEELFTAWFLGNAVEPGRWDREPEGKKLCKAIRAVPPGPKGARQFEERCLEALKYIFQNDFANWNTQKVSDKRLSRYDTIARIASSHDLWTGIVRYFHTWYVVFEFKNYSKKINQLQIVTTEKYLYAGAKRTVAVMISRKGADRGALNATRGAVREHGKLIIHLDIDDMCELLDLTDQGGDPNGLISDRVDGLLMALER